jgi:large subunit ribosomal protein L6
MSKIGRKPIHVKTAKIEVKGNTVLVSGQKVKFEHELPPEIKAAFAQNVLRLMFDENTRENRILLGLHRALLANKVKGVETGFEQKLTIVGLGFKVQQTGKKLIFTVGYTHKIEMELPDGVTVEIDKTGQQLSVKSADKFILGNVCDRIRSFRPPEPYKGTGIIRENEVIVRKAGKTKSA